MMRSIDQFNVILLDMMQTFMFDGDRFEVNANFGITYQRLGGTQLRDDRVEAIVRETYKNMERDYRNPDYYENFLSVRHYLAQVNDEFRCQLIPSELNLLERVFAMHEIGSIYDRYADIIKQLSQTHRLGIVANIWSQKDPVLQELRRLEILDCFDTLIFSSDYGIVKPSPALFQRAIDALGVCTSRILFVGDDYDLDIIGAKQLNLATAWINPLDKVLASTLVTPDLTIHDLSDLLTV
jgi:HAD superfamily hydrolase (TIGR01549 family)